MNPMKKLTTETKVHLEKRLIMENLTDEKIRAIEKELDKLANAGYNPEELRPFYERCKEYHLLNNVGYIQL